MQSGNFYFIKDDYFVDFPDPKLMQNKESVGGVMHSRPCFYAFFDESSSIYWLIPISSQLRKFRSIHHKKTERYGFCDTILFGQVLGYEKAFLIQNMCPVIPYYITEEYLDRSADTPVRIDGALEQELISKAKKVLALQRQGKPLIFPDVLHIEQELIKKLNASS